MKTIIAGTDFTASSINSCKYAALLAEKLNCRLTLFNMFEIPLVHSNVGLYSFSYSSTKKESQRKTDKVVKRLQKLFPEIEITTFVTSHAFEDAVRDFIASHKVQVAVMGLKAKGRISKFIYGSHGVKLAGKIKTPVIIVPENFRDHKLSNVLLAVDNSEKLYKTSLTHFEKLLARLKARLQLLHIRTEDEIVAPVISAIKLNNEKMLIKEMKAKDLQSGIRQYCNKYNVNLIAIISKKHSVFYNLFVESNTKKIAFAAKVPVLAIHE